jgi:apolipoprotein N-acyltransferase
LLIAQFEKERQKANPVNRAADLLLRYRHLAALFTGFLSAFGFQPWNIWPLTLASFALLIWLTAHATSRKQAFASGWLFGVGHFCWGLQWIAVSFTYQATMPTWLGYLSVFLLSLYLAVYPALGSLGAWWAGKTGGSSKTAISLPYLLAFSGFWIITEWLRSWVFTGFAWNPLSAAFLSTGLTAPLKYIGTYGASGLAILFASLALLTLAGRSVRWGIAMVLSCLALRTVSPPSQLAEMAKGQAITVVQPHITQEERYDILLESSNMGKLVKHTLRYPDDSKARLVFWSESALPWYLESGYPFRYYQNQPGESAVATREAISQLLGPNDILITGNDRLIIDQEGQLVGAHNSVAAMDAKGDILGWYDKAHLVPYGEYLALRWLLEPLGASRLVPGDIDFWPGPGAQTLNLGKGKPKVGFQICYEIIFSGQVVDRANRPDFIFNPSNDAWFGDIGPPQHLAQAQLRAVEEGLPVIRATPTGISAVIHPSGVIRQTDRLPLGQAGRIDSYLPPPDPPTLFSNYGNMLPLLFASFLISLGLFPVARKRLRR